MARWTECTPSGTLIEPLSSRERISGSDSLGIQLSGFCTIFYLVSGIFSYWGLVSLLEYEKASLYLNMNSTDLLTHQDPEKFILVPRVLLRMSVLLPTCFRANVRLPRLRCS